MTAFREILKEQGSNLISLLETLRKNSPAVYEQLTQKLYDDRELQKLLGEPIDKTVESIRRERMIVGEWVVMLDAAIAAMQATLTANRRTFRAFDRPRRCRVRHRRDQRRSRPHPQSDG